MRRESTAVIDHDRLKMFILDVLRHDVAEQISSILRLLNERGCIGWREHWPHDFTTEEVGAALRELAGAGQVHVLRESAAGDDLEPVEPSHLDREANPGSLWFGLTQRGRQLWDEWQPPVLEDVG